MLGTIFYVFLYFHKNILRKFNLELIDYTIGFNKISSNRRTLRDSERVLNCMLVGMKLEL